MARNTLFVMVCLVGVFFFLHTEAIGAPVYLPQTAQSQCYDENNQVEPCPGTGQDGDIQAGTPWPTPRFLDNGDGTLTDQLTGLTWLKDTNCTKSQYPGADKDGVGGDGAVQWKRALEIVEEMNANGLPKCASGRSDWRLPNINELSTLSNAGVADPDLWLMSQGFTSLHAWDRFWSSTTDANSKTLSWVYALGGQYAPAHKTASNYLVWPVRGVSSQPASVLKTGQDQCYDAFGTTCLCGDISYCPRGQDGEIQAGANLAGPRFTDPGDGTIIDNLTGLVWLRDAQCIATEYPNFDWDANDHDGRVTWQHGLDFVEGINAGKYMNCGGGKKDWRLPNIKELQSLVDFSQANPALPPGHPFRNVEKTTQYWSSTTCAISGFSCAKAVLIADRGAVSHFSKSSDLDVWPVRGGLGDEKLSLPSSPEFYVYPAVSYPASCSDPATTRPIAAGPVALGGDTFSLRIKLNAFSSPGDIYVAISAPFYPELLFVKADSGLQPLSIGLAAWKTNTAGPIDISLYGTIPVSLFPPGIYAFFIAVTPPGTIASHYLWGTAVAIP